MSNSGLILIVYEFDNIVIMYTTLLLCYYVVSIYEESSYNNVVFE